MSTARTADFGVGLASVNHVGITVADLDRSIAFYRALTGREPAGPVELPDTPEMARCIGVEDAALRAATLRLRNINIDLVEYRRPASGQRLAVNAPTAVHLCFEVDDFDGVYERLSAAGIDFAGEPPPVGPEHGVPKTAYFTDPDGVHLELILPVGPLVRTGEG
ncbi:VOC family protein [Streptomonospora arabica]|uniref:VOC family protein n=1 Tax=Streptomonospora arabica TaxID=412417 RepID=A0ABV9SHF4_9ACTN